MSTTEPSRVVDAPPSDAPPAPTRRCSAVLRDVVTGRPTLRRTRLVVGLAVAGGTCFLGYVAAVVAAFLSGAGCPDGDRLLGLGSVTAVVAVAGGIPALITGIRRVALVPFAIGGAGPGLILLALFLAPGHSPDCG